jgi:DNA primase
MTAVDEVKIRIDIVDLVSETVSLRRAGKNYTGFCPFHSNTRTPAFVVFPETGTWRCFSCNEGGDIFNFVMRKEGWDFQQTLRSLARRAGVELEPMTPEKKEKDERLDHLRGLLEETIVFFRHHLLQNPAGRRALEYLTRRSLTPETIERFGLGYAPASWDATHQHFLKKGYELADLLDSGLVVEREDGTSQYDRFRNRIVFPIRDNEGNITGFGARALQDEDMPKYLNSPQTVLFDKSRLLYGLDLARKSIRKEDQVVIVEGYMDVIGLHQAGFTNVVSPMGTALNEHQFRQLKRYTRRMVLALDADAAGEKATLRGLELARQALDRSPDFTPDASGLFDARGLIRYEARLQADLRVTTLPHGRDPDEIVNENPADWEQILEKAKPVVEHVMEMLTTDRDIDDPKVKREIADQVMPLIGDVPNAVERDAYRQKLARLLRVDERVLAAPTPQVSQRSLKADRRSVSGRFDPVQLKSNEKLADELETYCLKLMIRQPEILHQLDRVLQKAVLARFIPQEFLKADHQIIMRLIQQSLEQDAMEPAQFILENVPETLQPLTEELLKPLGKKEPGLVQLMEELVRVVLRLRSVRIELSIEQLRLFQQETAADDLLSMASYHEMILNYSRVREKLDLALSQPVQLD